MCRDELLGFIDVVNNYDNINYLFATIMWSAAPTLAKEKVSSLITFNDNRNLQNTWEVYKEQICEKLNVGCFELKKSEKSTIVLFFNEEELHKVLKDERNLEFLKRFGYYKEMTLRENLQFLKKRFENCCPHEMGIFLGYPIDDVTFFIDCPNKQCKMTGYWKVYHNIEEAKCTFNKFDRIKSNVIRLMINGTKPIEIASDMKNYHKHLIAI